MREGAWIHAGHWHWITEHAFWIQKPENARLLGIPEEVMTQLSAIPWDFNGPGRVAILRLAMGEGLIRMRGHGAFVTFEFTLPIATAIQSVRQFVDQNFGPKTWCQFNDLETGKSLGIYYENL